MHGRTPKHRSSPVATLGEGELLRLGEWVRDASLTLGGGSLTDPLEAMLFHEALTDAIDTLSARQSMREAMQKHSGYEDVSAPTLPISLEDTAQQIIDRAFADDFSGPPPETEQTARIHFALKLDPRCSDAYVIQGSLDERAGRYPQAQAAYEQAMALAAEKLGPDATASKSRKVERMHFWYSRGTREYMRPRAALAYLLWQKMGQLKEASAHFQAMLTLNPGDNQGNRDALLCCLLEAGDDEALGKALADWHFDTRETIEPQDIAGTVWHYTHACWLFRTHPPTTEGEGSQSATAALRKAFRYNQYVPRFLLAPQGLPGLHELAPYALGDPTEAVMYVNLALKGWQKATGALTWLETTARQARLLPTGQRSGKAQPITVSGDELKLAALEKIEVPQEVLDLRADLIDCFPPTGLLEVLMEVDQWTNISPTFLRLTSRREPTAEAIAEVRPPLFAVLVAEATNIGLSAMAQSSGIALHELERVYDWYLREETLRAAISRLINYHRSLPLTMKFGDGTTSSSDGIRFGMAASSLHARHLPRYFGVRRGVYVIWNWPLWYHWNIKRMRRGHQGVTVNENQRI